MAPRLPGRSLRPTVSTNSRSSSNENEIACSNRPVASNGMSGATGMQPVDGMQETHLNDHKISRIWLICGVNSYIRQVSLLNQTW
jgi:hypothetical protein